MSWKDILLRPVELPEILQLNINGEIKTWELGEAAVYQEKEYLKNTSWNIEEKVDPNPRHRIYRSLCTLPA